MSAAYERKSLIFDSPVWARVGPHFIGFLAKSALLAEFSPRVPSSARGNKKVRFEQRVIFRSAAITFGVDIQRNSEDIDYVVSEAFLAWAESRRKHDTDLAVDLADEAIFNLCGKWRERTCFLQGLLETRFRLLHPMDVVMQKLLRRDPIEFEEKGIPDIQVILDKLRPTSEALMGLLTKIH